MKIAIGADHAGFRLKERLVWSLESRDHEVEDLGTFSEDDVDYPEIAVAVAEVVKEDAATRGVLICGTGVGMAIAANKIAGIRAATCNDLYTARMARAHNNANILAVGSRVVGPQLAEEIARTFMATEWEEGRHKPRVKKIHDLE
ncbi:MAG: ribose 5-phosphate isomerase B [bacterium]|nr:ribose 5-phosphate isomerase B [bacterium]